VQDGTGCARRKYLMVSPPVPHHRLLGKPVSPVYAQGCALLDEALGEALGDILAGQMSAHNKQRIEWDAPLAFVYGLVKINPWTPFVSVSRTRDTGASCLGSGFVNLSM